MIMAHNVLQEVLVAIHTSPFLSLIVDEATDISNKEQLAVIIRRVGGDFTAFDDFLGLYQITATDTENIVAAVKDVLLRFQIPISMLWGQCYDGCCATSGKKLVLQQWSRKKSQKLSLHTVMAMR